MKKYRESPDRQAYMEKYRASMSPEKKLTQRRRSRLSPYDLTPEQFDELLAKQGHECPICTRMLTRPVVDHQHVTRRVRGLLCQRCNVGLGLFEENTDNLERAIKYLLKSWSGATSTRSSED